MENRIIYYVNKVVHEENFLLYKAISDFFLEYNYQDGYVNALQAIFDISGNTSYLLKIGDHFKENGQNDLAHSYYNMLLKENNKNLYERLEQTNPSSCYAQDIRACYGNDKALIKLIDKNVLLVHLLKLALDYDLKQLVVELSKNIGVVAEKINTHLEYSNSGFAANLSKAYEIQEVLDDYRFLSNELSKKKHHNDLNNLAISLDPYNELAYFNIMDDFVVYDNPQKALEYYNSTYIKPFQRIEVQNLRVLYQNMQDFYHKRGDYYKVVYYQKLIIEEGLKV